MHLLFNEFYHRFYDQILKPAAFPVDTRRRFNVYKTSIRRRIDVLSTLKRRRMSIGLRDTYLNFQEEGSAVFAGYFMMI